MHSDREKLVERLRTKAAMIELGEKIAWGSETSLMRDAADEIERLEAALSEQEKKPASEPGEAVALWRVGEWGDGSTKTGEAVIFCDAHEAAIAAGVPSHLAKMIVEAHNDTLASPAPVSPSDYRSGGSNHATVKQRQAAQAQAGNEQGVEADGHRQSVPAMRPESGNEEARPVPGHAADRMGVPLVRGGGGSEIAAGRAALNEAAK